MHERIPHQNRKRHFDVDLKINKLKFHRFCSWTVNFFVTHNIIIRAYLPIRRVPPPKCPVWSHSEGCGWKKYLLPSDTERRYCDRMINVYLCYEIRNCQIKKIKKTTRKLSWNHSTKLYPVSGEKYIKIQNND